jgi:hypothetical protein
LPVPGGPRNSASSWRAMKAPAARSKTRLRFIFIVESEVEVVESLLRVAECFPARNSHPVLFVDSFGLETGNLNNLVPGPNGETAKNIPNPSNQWPQNGNLWPGFKPQDGICTTGLFSNMMNSRPCVKRCCKEHDDCYTKFNCNASSFLGGLPGPCQVCNIKAEFCILTADKSRGGGDCKCSK